MGFVLNLWVLIIFWIGGELDKPELEHGLVLSSGKEVPYDYAYYFMRNLSFGSVLASMIAYLTAQFIDVRIYHWVKQKTQGRKLWLRNNISTLISQLIDSIAVILITHYTTPQGLDMTGGRTVIQTLTIYILSSYLFKLIFALIDTLPIYIAVKKLRHYLGLKPNEEV